jgi:hypothetical protein
MPLNKDIATKNHRTTSQYLVDSKNDEPINTSTSIPSSKSTKKGMGDEYAEYMKLMIFHLDPTVILSSVSLIFFKAQVLPISQRRHQKVSNMM